MTKGGQILRIAYLILAHSKPRQLIKLINALKNDNLTCFVIHYDSRASDCEYKELIDEFSNNPYIYFVEKRVKCFWGDFSLVEATLECMKCLEENNITYNYAVLLSGQDYPIKSNGEIFQFFQENYGSEFIECEKFPVKKWWGGGMNRLHYYYYNKSDNALKYVKCSMISLLRKIKVKRKLPEMDFYGGSQWWALTNEAIKFIIDYVNRNKLSVSFFEYSHIPDEIFFHTIIMNSHFKTAIKNDNLKYIHWIKHDQSSPSVLRAEDIDSILNIKKLFARKFDMNTDYKIIELLDSVIKPPSALGLDALKIK